MAVAGLRILEVGGVPRVLSERLLPLESLQFGVDDAHLIPAVKHERVALELKHVADRDLGLAVHVLGDRTGGLPEEPGGFFMDEPQPDFGGLKMPR